MSLNKKSLTERDICTKFINPALEAVGWDLMHQIREQYYFTAGRVMVRGKTVKRGERKFADFLLLYKPNIPLAVIEAKDNNHSIGSGMQQSADTRQAGSLSHAHRLRDHFDRLFDTPTTLPQLRQAILQLAVQGQLVPQDPNDEPADVLMQRLREYKERHPIAGIQRKKKDAVDGLTEKPSYEIPTNWTWASLDEITLQINDRNYGESHPKPSDYFDCMSCLRIVTGSHIERLRRCRFHGRAPTNNCRKNGLM